MLKRRSSRGKTTLCETCKHLIQISYFLWEKNQSKNNLDETYFIFENEDLYMAIVLLDVFKPLQVKSQDCWKLLNSHPLVGLLETTPLEIKIWIRIVLIILIIIHLSNIDRQQWQHCEHLVRAASVALELVVRAQGLRWREVPKIEKAVTKLIKIKKIRDLRQEVTEVFWSTSMLKSQNSSSFDVTVSQFRHRVSLVRIPCV